MHVLGLTGSIATGKSTTARLLRRWGVPVHDSDAAVAALMAAGGAGVAPVAALVPDAPLIAADGGIDRALLRRLAFERPDLRPALESVLHPLVRAGQQRFLDAARKAGHRVAVLDIPLLYETGAEARCDSVLTMTAPPWIQYRRALSRPGMTPERLATVLSWQVPDAEKRARADFVLSSAYGRPYVARRLRRILRRLKHRG